MTLTGDLVEKAQATLNAITDAGALQVYVGASGVVHTSWNSQKPVAVLAAALSDAIAAERERCAKVAEGFAHAIAAAIRKGA